MIRKADIRESEAAVPGKGKTRRSTEAQAKGEAAATRPETEAQTEVQTEAQTATATAAEESGRSLVRLESAELRGAVEALLFSVAEPISIRGLSELLEVSVHEAREAVEELRLEYMETGRAFRVEDIAGGIQLLTQKQFDPWIRRLRQKEKEGRLSPAALETLAVIAYKQPINKADLESIRGVGCTPILKTLLDRGLVQIVGRGEGLGRPLLYGTTRRFLESFGLGSLRDLPQPELSEPPREDGAPGASRVAAAPEESADLPAPSITTASGPLS